MLINENILLKEIQNLLKKQNSKEILYITEGVKSKIDINCLMNDFNELEVTSLQHFMDNKPIKMYDVVIVDINPYLYNNDEIISLINQLLSYVTNSLLTVVDMYCDELGNNSDMISGIRKFHPILFADFDFSYKIINDNLMSYQVYNFFPEEKFTLLEQDMIYDKICEFFNSENIKMNIAYVLPHLKLTGGIKYLLSHAKFLKKRGHNVYLMYEGNVTNVIPKWSNIDSEQDISGQIIIPHNKDYTPYLREYSIDIMVAGFFTQLDKLCNYEVPVLYWEQGSESLYGEFGELLANNSTIRQTFKNAYRSNVYIASVSPIVARILNKKYGRKTPILYTGVDTCFYHPEKKPLRTWPQILLVGTPSLRFKGFDLIINVLEMLWNNGYKFQTRWATQTNIESCNVSFPIEIDYEVPQEKLAELYHSADLFISASHFESFPMPPMEAFASGTAVVAVNNGGIELYAKPGENILLAEQGNAYDLYSAIQYLLEKPDAMKVLAKNARIDSLQYSVEVAIDQLEEILAKIIYDNKKDKYETKTIIEKNQVKNFSSNLQQNDIINNFNGLQEMINTGEGIEAVLSFLPKNTIKSRLEILTDLSENKKILHVGCTDHLPIIDYKIRENIWLHGLLTKKAKRVLGIDINDEAINYLHKRNINNVIYGDITQPNNKDIVSEIWDYVIFAEVLEHINSPVDFLKAVKNNYQKNISYCIITVPNAFGLPFLNCALASGEERINPDHKYWFSPYTLWKVINEAGLKVELIDTCAYENSYNYLQMNRELVLSKPILQDTIIAICKFK